jgi:biotin-(acetyl-CoA carboxylase) ligase
LAADAATCIEQHHIDITPAELVAAITEAIVLRAPELDSDTLLDELAATIDTIGREVRLELPDGRILTGMATGIGAAGSLIVEAAGTNQEFTAADVTHLRIGGDEDR